METIMSILIAYVGSLQYYWYALTVVDPVFFMEFEIPSSEPIIVLRPGDDGGSPPHPV